MDITASERVSFSLQFYDYHAIFLFFACLIYGLFGSPTPDHFGVAEFVIGALLGLSVGFGRMRDVLFGQSMGHLFLLYGLSVPLIVAAFAGHGLGAILRDILPFLFLFLPLFFLPVLCARPHYYRSLVVVVILIGLLFSLRSLLMRFEFSCPVWCSGELLYLENMPTVLFTALFLIGRGLSVMARGLSLRNLAVFGGLMALALLPVAAMAVTAQRASLAAVLLYVLIVQGIIMYRSPARGVNAMILGTVGFILLNASFMSLFATLYQKTADVGLNMRPQEFASVWQVVTADPLTFFFGIGWGGSFVNPAVGGLAVNFTHNFFSSLFLKAGLLGAVLAALYIAGLLERLVRVILRAPVVGLALAFPILIDLTLYASFKSLDFGLMLLMISGFLVYIKQCADQRY